MSLKIKCKLDESSLEDAIKQLEDYHKDLEAKVYMFVSALAQDGVAVASVRLGAAVGDATEGYVDLAVNSNGDITLGYVYLGGKDALFIEFGAGIAYNTGQQHPYADEFGYGPGTYPSKHPPNKAINPGRWVYGHNDDGTPIWSIGTMAMMPIYHAAETARNNAIKRAIEIFRS